jgi:hypothetical protein
VLFIVVALLILPASEIVIIFFLKNFEQEVVSKVWNGEVELGVECSSFGYKGVGLKEVCLKEILENELRDGEESIRREHKKAVHQ